jgi:hypothetical protein
MGFGQENEDVAEGLTEFGWRLGGAPRVGVTRPEKTPSTTSYG